MPALMDSAVLLAADAAIAVTPLPHGKAAYKAECSLPSAPATVPSGTLEDWQVLSASEIRMALPPGTAAPSESAEEAAEPPAGLSISPAKPRVARTRRGKPKTPTSPRPLGTDDGADADAESPPPVAAASTPSGSLLPGCASASGNGSSKVIRVWNPFSGLKLMGARHKAGSHILDLATPPGASAAAAAVPIVAASQAPAAAGDKPAVAAAAATAAMTDSAPDMDAILSDDASGTIAEACPDYDTARECGGLSSSKHSAGLRSPGKASLADAAGSVTEGRGSGGIDDSVACDFAVAGAMPCRKVPAAAADYVLPHKTSQKRKKKERKMKRRQGKD